MSPKRIKQRLADFQKALGRLHDVLQEDPAKTSAIIDGTIQRFEFTFELAWKLGRAYLLHTGIEANNPRAVIKELYQQGMIQDGDGWIEMLEDRNKTTHLYDEQEALAVYKKIKGRYEDLLDKFRDRILPLVGGVKEE